MSMRKYKLVFLGIILLLSLIGCSGQKSQKELLDSSKAEIMMHNLSDFNAHYLDQIGEFTPDDLQEYDLTIMMFWSTSSEISQIPLPQIAEYKKNKKKNIRIVTICIDGEKHPKKAKKILNEANYHGKTIISGEKDFYVLMKSVRFVPTIVFVNANGELVHSPIIGTVDNLDITLDKILKRKHN